ncbi:hypothetical protein BC941DRAFT_457090 [Chlamydoabsidia padenii]|nr:hypothetical protein BC941DRAFT_457090 [Chlamydoabsidia padenii]
MSIPDMVTDAYSFPIDPSEDMIYGQKMDYSEYQYQQQVINDPLALHLEEQQPEEIETKKMAEEPVYQTPDIQTKVAIPHVPEEEEEEKEMPTNPTHSSSAEIETPANPILAEEEMPTDPAQTSSSTKEEIPTKTMPEEETPIQKGETPLRLKQAAINPPPPAAVPSSSSPPPLPHPPTNKPSGPSTTIKPGLASVAPRQQEKPPMGQHSEPNIPPGIPQQQPPSKPVVPPGSDLGTLGRIGVFGEDSFAVHNSTIPFMQILFFCFFSIWFVLYVKRS